LSATKIIPFRWGWPRCAGVLLRLLSISVCGAVGFCWWSLGEQPILDAQKTNQAVSGGPTHKAGSEQGRKLFETSCAGCHGLDGRGGEKGPNIATRPEISKRSDGEILAILQHGLPGAGMPAFSRLGDAKLQAVVRHLRTLQNLNSKMLVAGNTDEGRTVFFKKGGCGTCHMINGAGGFLGSDLSKYGAITSVADMREQIMNHDQSPRARTILVSTRDGRTLSGFARNEDNFSLQLQTLDGKFHFLDKSTLVSVDYSPAASAVDAEKQLSESELDALVSYLVSVARSSQDGGKLKTPRRHQEEDDN
jgi:cytochrome c oxidase cbb3-type subunit III